MVGKRKNELAKELKNLEPVAVDHTIYRNISISGKRKTRNDRTKPASPERIRAAVSVREDIQEIGSSPESVQDNETWQEIVQEADALLERMREHLPENTQRADSPLGTDATAFTGDDAEAMQNKIINEEYKVWRKNAVFLYDIMYSRALEWPTLTTQWLPDVKEVPGKPFREHRLIIGTHTSGQAQDYLQIAHINLPNPPAAKLEDYNPESEELGGYGAAKDPIQFSVVQKINHPTEVNKARYMPQNPDLIATWASNGYCYVWDRTKHPSVPKPNEVLPQITLKGHKEEGYALEWNPQKEGQLITGSEDKTVCLWNVQDYSKSSPILYPARTFTHHTATVNDVQFFPHYGTNFFGSVSDDRSFCFVDLRRETNTRPAIKIPNAHTDDVNTLAFHPTFDKLFATGGADKSIGIWDLRFPGQRISSLEGHRDVITKLDWHPHDSGILASCSDDRRIIFWDLPRAGLEQTSEDAQDGPPEMLFMHGGHTNRVSDFSWNRNDPWVMCSASEDNLVQMWRATRHLVEKMPAQVQRREVSE